MNSKSHPRFYPSIEAIKQQKVPPTEGERTMLNFLYKVLDNTYEVYNEPFLNGDRPDIVVMRKGSGVLIIEVKDWDLDLYDIECGDKDHGKGRNGKHWTLLDDKKARIKSPFAQVNKYKENIYNLHSSELFEAKIKDKNYWSSVSCMVYFHCADQKIINMLKGRDKSVNSNTLNFIEAIGKDTLQIDFLNKYLNRIYLCRKSEYFNNSLYKSLKRLLKPPMHEIEEGKDIFYTPEQQKLIVSEIKPRRKIKGVAGSGKTLVLAKRAVNAHIRTGGKVLILTYNLTLCNYIRDRISDVREKFHWDNFYITNYHQLVTQEANNFGIILTIEENEDIELKRKYDSYYNIELFDNVKPPIQKYDAIFIDEIQDYEQEWLDIITKYFMHEDTEFVVFGDEKQNVYGRKMDHTKEPIVRKIPGAWNKSLKKSHRFTTNIADLANAFQKEVYKHKYNYDDIETQPSLDFEKRILEYHNYDNHSYKDVVASITNLIHQYSIHPSDITILATDVEPLREIGDIISKKYKEGLTTTFESKDEYDRYKEDKVRIDKVRRGRKVHFWMKSGTMKLSTIHSFKGWEGNSVFFILKGNERPSESEAELIYTAITRARKNLFIMSKGNSVYDNFFKKHIQNCFEH
jgi:hypothetical protein